jgi:thiol-disulfide isomerase/thioredoxin
MSKNKAWQFLLLLFVPVAIYNTACSNKNTENQNQKWLGNYKMVFETPSHELPVHFNIEEKNGSLFPYFDNGRDTFFLEEIKVIKDTLFFETPIYKTAFQLWFSPNKDSLKGVFINDEDLRYTIPVYAVKSHKILGEPEPDLSKISPNYNANMVNIYKREYPAVGLFDIADNGFIYGTFATQFGDFRALKGTVVNNQLRLSGFDGVRISYFFADIKGDSLINGVIVNQKGLSAKWAAEKSDTPHLKNPQEITYYEPENNTFKANIFNLKGEPVSYQPTGKLAIIQISGTWCPNCKDETKLLTEMYNKYSDKGLEIITVGFERQKDMQEVEKRLLRYKESYKAPYTFFYGGEPKAEFIEKAFPGIQNFYSYPSTIFVNDKSEVITVFSGFYGPETGILHLRHIETIEAIIKENLGLS